MYKYYKSDFTIHIRHNIKRQTSTGEMVPVTNDVPINVRLYIDQNGTAETGYLAYYDGEETHNCTILSPQDILVYYDRTQLPLPVGRLFIEIEFCYPDEHYEGDGTNNIKRLYFSGIELTDNPDLDDEGEITVEILNEVLAYEVIRQAEGGAKIVANQVAREIIPAIAATEAQKAVQSFVLASPSDIDALWQ